MKLLIEQNSIFVIIRLLSSFPLLTFHPTTLNSGHHKKLHNNGPPFTLGGTSLRNQQWHDQVRPHLRGPQIAYTSRLSASQHGVP